MTSTKNNVTEENNSNSTEVQQDSREQLSFPRPPPNGRNYYSYYDGEGTVTTRVIHLDGDVGGNNVEEDVISTTIVVSNSYPNDGNNNINMVTRRLAHTVSVPPGFEDVEPNVEEEDYDVIIRERRCPRPQQPLPPFPLWYSCVHTQLVLDQKLLQPDDNVPYWLMGLVQFPLPASGSQLQFWLTQGGRPGVVSVSGEMMLLDGAEMIRKIQGIATNAGFDNSERFFVHLIDADVFVAQDSAKQVVQTIKRLMRLYGRSCPPPTALQQQADDDGNIILVTQGPVEATAMENGNAIRPFRQASFHPRHPENFPFGGRTGRADADSYSVVNELVYEYEDISDNNTLATTPLEDEESVSLRGEPLRRRLSLTGVIRGRSSLRRLSSVDLVGMGGTTEQQDHARNQGLRGRRSRRLVRLWTALCRGFCTTFVPFRMFEMTRMRPHRRSD